MSKAVRLLVALRTWIRISAEESWWGSVHHMANVQSPGALSFNSAFSERIISNALTPADLK